MLNIIENKARSENRSIEIDAQYFEYSKAANPIAAKIISRIPYRNFPASIYAEARTQVIPLDLSLELGCAVPATGPGLLASFVRIIAGEKNFSVFTQHITNFYVIRGNGEAIQGQDHIPFTAGAFFALPGGITATLTAETDTALYYVNDSPLLSYLGVDSVLPRFQPTLYPAVRMNSELKKSLKKKMQGYAVVFRSC